MTEDRHAGHPEQRSPAVFGVIEEAQDSIDLRLLLYARLAENADHEASHGFIELEKCVPDKTRADEDVARPGDDLVSLDVSDKVDLSVCARSLYARPPHRPPSLLLPHVEQADAGSRHSVRVAEVDRSESSILMELVCRALTCAPTSTTSM